MDITVLFTCHNRIDATRKCVNSLDDPGFNIRYVAVDDGSTDGTGEMLKKFATERKRELVLIQGDGTLYWAGGMRVAMETVLKKNLISDYILLVNDDVEFYADSVKRMIDRSIEHVHSCIVGVTCGTDGEISYGGYSYDMRHAKEKAMSFSEADNSCDAVNMNAFLIPYDMFHKTGIFDSHYTHRMADFDYSFMLRRNGAKIYMTNFYVGVCEKNVHKGTWEDTGLSRRERLRLKESPKGLPAKEWFYYLNKNMGIMTALWHSLTPYIRILIGA